ncbi:MAG: toxin-antitoxin system HicB family antitoxin [Elusimicrobiota bacterium]
MKKYAGKILIRVPSKIHKELNKEAVQTGSSINDLCVRAILARKALKQYDPWKSVEQVWSTNKNISEKELNKDIFKAIKAVRNEK